MEVHNEALLYNVEVSTSDHTPILLEVNEREKMKVGKHFRFENAWLRESMCKDIVLSYWESNEGMGYEQKILDYQRKLGLWGKKITGNFSQRIRDCKHRLKHLKQRRDDNSIRLYAEE